jgi:hypothetical protein
MNRLESESSFWRYASICSIVSVIFSHSGPERQIELFHRLRPETQLNFNEWVKPKLLYEQGNGAFCERDLKMNHKLLTVKD